MKNSKRTGKKHFLYLIKTIIYLFLTASVVSAYNELPEESVHWKQFFAILAAVFAFLTMRNIWKFMQKEYGDKIRKTFKEILMRVIEFSRKLIDRVMKRLGIKGRNLYYGAGNKRRFIFPDEIRKMRASSEKAMRWRDMDTNEKKIRYLYAMFIVRRIKSGYTYRESFTARRVKSDLADENSAILFDLYEAARYTPSPQISEDEVEKVRKLK